MTISTPQCRCVCVAIRTENATFLHCRLKEKATKRCGLLFFLTFRWKNLRDVVSVWSTGDCVRSFCDKVHKRYKDNFRFHRVAKVALLLLHNWHILVRRQLKKKTKIEANIEKFFEFFLPVVAFFFFEFDGETFIVDQNNDESFKTSFQSGCELFDVSTDASCVDSLGGVNG